jgi:response regulator RpfG family c-di-GMP phosphodiesterase
MALNKILLVDDDPNILSAYTRTLRKQFQFETALGGAEGLAAIAACGPFAVILSDMRMPGMDGIEFLSRARDAAPDSVRIMLTGNADQQTAIDAVNRGNIFRFLTKPCGPEDLALSLEAGIKQYRLVTAERELVEGTLAGSIDLLVEMLAISSPLAFGLSQRLSPLAERVARVMDIPATWPISMAAVLSQIGILTLPVSVVARVRRGERVTAKELETYERLPEISSSLVRRIPRMEEVADIILYSAKNFDGTGFPDQAVAGEQIPLGARILRVCLGYLEHLHQPRDSAAALETMAYEGTRYDPQVLVALTLALKVPDDHLAQADAGPHLVTHDLLEEGMVLVDGVETQEGVLVYPALTRLGPSHLERLTNFARLMGLKEPFQVQR